MDLGTELTHPPTDGISRVEFARYQDKLLASSWDTQLYLYDAPRNQVLGKWAIDNRPLLHCAFQGDSAGIAGGLHGTLHRLDLETSQGRAMGVHAGPVSFCAWAPAMSLVISGSWDQTLRMWDPRGPPGSGAVATVPLNGKLLTADLSRGAETLVLGTSSRHLYVLDVRRLHSGPGAVSLLQESHLKHQTRSIAAFPDGSGFAMASTEGRAAIEFLPPPEGAPDPGPSSGRTKYAFKCHRRAEQGVDVAYPVNDVAFHPVNTSVFATGGADGTLCTWDRDLKKRVAKVSGYSSGISSLAYNHDGSLLAVASSYTFEQGDVPHGPDAIYIRSAG